MQPGRRSRVVFFFLVALVGLLATSQGIAAPRPPRPPEQPADGPGGAAFAFAGVEATRLGRLPDGAWLFTPTDLRLAETVDRATAPMPVVIFLHGFTAVDPAVYRSWIDHLVRRGAIVIYPDYQTISPFAVGFESFLGHALTGIRAALRELETGTTARPDLSRVAVVGHSLGGVLAVNYAAVAALEGLPIPTALMPIQPGGCTGCGELLPDRGAPLEDLAAIAPSTRVLVIVGDDDSIVGDRPAKTIWSAMPHIPPPNRDYVTLRSDHRGLPPLRATHLLAQTAGIGGYEDALDWYGTWKLLDALMACTFEREWCETALDNTPAQRHMGLWSDGEPVSEARVTDDPGPP